MFRDLFDFEPHYNPYWPWGNFWNPYYPYTTSTTWEKFDNTNDEGCNTKLKDCDDEKCSEKPQTYYKEVYEEYVNGEKVKSKEREYVNGKMTKNESYNKQLSESKEEGYLGVNKEKPKLDLKKEEKKDVACTEKPSEDADMRKQLAQLEKENKVLRKQLSMIRRTLGEI